MGRNLAERKAIQHLAEQEIRKPAKRTKLSLLKEVDVLLVYITRRDHEAGQRRYNGQELANVFYTTEEATLQKNDIKRLIYLAK